MKKFRHLHIAFVLSGLLTALIFKHRSWFETLAYLLGLAYCCWNVFAYIHERNMVALPRMVGNLSRNGDKGLRQHLFVVSVFLFLLLSVLWIWRSTVET